MRLEIKFNFIKLSKTKIAIKIIKIKIEIRK
jgi:hypothetical protein